jgi:hypothetical protein
MCNTACQITIKQMQTRRDNHVTEMKGRIYEKDYSTNPHVNPEKNGYRAMYPKENAIVVALIDH